MKTLAQFKATLKDSLLIIKQIVHLRSMRTFNNESVCLQRGATFFLLFPSLDNKYLPKLGILLKESICSSRRKFVLLRGLIREMRQKNKIGRIASSETVDMTEILLKRT